MAGWSPPTIPRELLVASGLVYVALLGYGFFIAQELLLFGLLPVLLAMTAYWLWRLLRTLEAIADALHRIAQQTDLD